MALNNPILDATLNNINLDEIKRDMGAPPWARTVVEADHMRAVVICQPSGKVNDNHCHDFDEWWFVLEGEIDWIIEGREDRPVQAKQGDFIFVPAMTFHHIFPKGDAASIRLAISLPGKGHLHERPERKAKIVIE